MALFIAKRLGAAVLLVIGTILVAFLLTAVLPGDAATARLGRSRVIAALSRDVRRISSALDAFRHLRDCW